MRQAALRKQQLVVASSVIGSVVAELRRRKLWQPFPDKIDGTQHPQRRALESKADIVGYGGQAGGGKTDLLLGASLNHHRGIIFRREFPRLTSIIDRSRQIFNPETQSASADLYNEGLHRWRFNDGRILYFGSLQYEKDVLAQQGQPKDYHAFDELTEFSEYMFRFVTGWNRSAKPGQRCRIIATMNPPVDQEGMWVVAYFAPWLDDKHPRPALEGELRWYTTIAGKDVECEDGRPFILGEEGEHVYDYDEDAVPPEDVCYPRSRTFIFASVSDNPILLKSGYVSVLQGLPEPLRSKLLLGDFKSGIGEDAYQIIPTAWVAAAQARWRERQGQPLPPLSSLGVDVARGGQDFSVTVARHNNRFNVCFALPGSNTPNGQTLAGQVMMKAHRTTPINVDIIGVGGSVFDHLIQSGYCAVSLNGAEASSGRDAKTGRLGFVNKRAEWWWRLREALDPDSGQDLAIEDDPELRADLCAPRWFLALRGIQVEAKEDLKKRIRRSPDKGEALVYASVLTGFASANDFVTLGALGASSESPWGGSAHV